MIYSKEELQQIADVCQEKDIWIISDEIYEKLIYGGEKHVSIAQLSDDAKKRTFIINGVSKSHSMTGWRIGYIAGDAEVVNAMTDLASHSTSNPTTTSQYATIEAYNGPQDAVETMRKDFESRLEQSLSSTMRLFLDLTSLSRKAHSIFFQKYQKQLRKQGLQMWMISLRHY